MVTTLVMGMGLLGAGGMLEAKVMDLGRSTGGSPYERYMGPVKEVLGAAAARDSEWDRVTELLRTARSFRYRHNEAYVANSPEVTGRTRTGDCKDKSLWLLAKMGSDNARFTIGKLKADSDINHAWVYWQAADGGWYILDPTHRSRPLAVEDVRRHEYIPMYSYADNGTYHHDADRPVAASSERRVERIAQTEDETRRHQAQARTARVSVSERQTGRTERAESGGRSDSSRGFAARLNRLDRGRGVL